MVRSASSLFALLLLTGCACAFTRADADKSGKALWPSCLAAYSIKSAACSTGTTDPQNCPGR